ncbi:MAG: nuclear transport factor 2 family protein [Pseudomonadota bacterium]
MFDATLMEVGTKLVALSQAGKAREGLDTLYSEDAVSVEAARMPGAEGTETHGLPAIRGKHDWWDSTMEMHSASAEGPFFHGEDSFGVIFEADVTDKENGRRMQMKELGIYTIKDGKIVREEFYYQAEG